MYSQARVQITQARTQDVDWGGAFQYIVDFNYPGTAAELAVALGGKNRKIHTK